MVATIMTKKQRTFSRGPKFSAVGIYLYACTRIRKDYRGSTYVYERFKTRNNDTMRPEIEKQKATYDALVWVD